MSVWIGQIEAILGEVPDDFQAVLVLLKKESSWVLIKNRNRLWEFPGGHREQGESIEQTAHREAWEEAGAKIRIEKTLGYYKIPHGLTTVVVLAEALLLGDLPEGFESIEVRLFDRLPNAKSHPLTFDDGIYEFFIASLSNKTPGCPTLV